MTKTGKQLLTIIFTVDNYEFIITISKVFNAMMVITLQCQHQNENLNDLFLINKKKFLKSLTLFFFIYVTVLVKH